MLQIKPDLIKCLIDKDKANSVAQLTQDALTQLWWTSIFSQNVFFFAIYWLSKQYRNKPTEENNIFNGLLKEENRSSKKLTGRNPSQESVLIQHLRRARKIFKESWKGGPIRGGEVHFAQTIFGNL